MRAVIGLRYPETSGVSAPVRNGYRLFRKVMQDEDCLQSVKPHSEFRQRSCPDRPRRRLHSGHHAHVIAGSAADGCRPRFRFDGRKPLEIKRTK